MQASSALETVPPEERNTLRLHLPPVIGFARASDALLEMRPIAGLEWEYEAVPMPTNDEGQHFNTMEVTGLTMSKASRNKEAAWELMRFIVGGGNDDLGGVDFVAHNTLAVHSPNYDFESEISKQLHRLIRSEMAHAQVSSLALVPSYFGGKNDEMYEVPWQLPYDSHLRTYMHNLAQSLDRLRDEMKAQPLHLF